MIKKLSALILALICVVSMTMPAFAEEHTSHGELVNGADPTCTENGFLEYEDGCKIVIEATGHDYSSVTTVYHCIDQAEIITYTCDTCGYTYNETIRAVTGEHTWEIIDAVEATCQTAGNNGGKRCSECGIDKPDEIATEIPQRTHVLGDANSSLYLYGSTESCNDAGNPIWKCKFCDYQFIDTASSIAEYCVVLNPSSEYFVEKDAVAPSCFENGKEADKYCKFCDVLAIQGAVIPATEQHDLKLEGKVEATCHSDGYSGDMLCQTEGCTYKELGSVIPATEQHDLKLEGKVEATCHSDGYSGDMVCQTEGCTYKELGSVIPATEQHDLKLEGKVEATCHSKGYTGDKVCQTDGCTYKELGEDIAVKPHNYEIYYVEEPTCAKEGYGYDKCKDCGYYDPETGHNIPTHSATLEVIPAVDPTCQKTGLTAGKRCSKCEKTIEEQNVVPVISCDQNVSIPAKAATCTEDGHADDGKKCSMCGDITKNPTVISALGHLEDSDIPAVAPTCTEDGSEGGKTCSRCGAETVAPTVIPALGHLEDADIPAVAPTCTEDGSEGGKTCSRCGAETVAPAVIPALGHLDDIALEAKAPTCTNTGLTAGIKCSRCNEETTPQDILPIDANAHVEKIIPAVDPTCTAPGATEGKVCSECGLVLLSTVIIPSNGHVNTVLELVNCAENVEGYTIYKCEVCGEESRHDCAHKDITVNEPATCTEDGRMEYSCGYAYNIEALGHDKIIVQAVAPTCTTEGSTAGITCGRCSKVILTSTVIPALGHLEDADIPAVAPTCTEDGSEGGKTCSRCGAETVAPAVIPALGHDVIAHEAKAPTCTEIGWDAYETCSRCDNTNYVEIPANGHNIVDIARVEPTCISIGYTAGKGCTECDYIEVKPQVIPANGHSWVLESTLSVAPTCSRDGKEVYYCKDCGESYEKVVYATGNHNYVIIETQAATCTEQGYSKNRCTVCGDTFSAPELPTGHTESIDKGFAPTCTATGLTDGSHCGRCGDLLKEQVVIPAAGHKSEIVKGYASTCTTTGLTEGSYCGHCGIVLKEQVVIPAAGHKSEIVKGYASTCIATGLTDGQKCSVCNAVTKEQEIVAKKSHNYNISSTTKATLSKNGKIYNKCSDCANSTSQTIYYPKTIKLSTTTYTYNGNVRKPSLKITDSNGKTISSANYTVSYASGRKYPGKYKVTVKFKGNYEGTKTLYFTIKPKKASLSSVKSTAKKKMTVKWSKQSEVSGYQIVYATNSKFTKGKKTVTVSGSSSKSKTIKSLKSNKTYYVKVRAYKTIDGKKVYGSYSKYIKVKIK